MKRVLWILVLILLVFYCQADWILPEDNISYGDETFIITISEESVIFKSNDSTRPIVVVNLEEFEINGLEKFSYNGKKSEQKDIDKYNVSSIHGKNITYLYDVEIEKLDTGIDIERKFSEKKIYFKDLVNVSYTLTNDGDVPVFGTYLENIPKYFSPDSKLIVKRDDEEKKYDIDDVIDLSFSILPDDDLEFSVVLELIGYTTDNNIDLNEGIFTYKYKSYEFVEELEPSGPDYIKPVDITFETEKYFNVDGKYEILIDADSVENLSFDLEVRDPIGFEIVDETGFDDLEWSDIWDDDDLMVEIEPHISGEIDLVIIAEYEFRKHDFKDVVIYSNEVKFNEPTVELNLPRKVDSNKNLNVIFEITPKHDIEDVNIIIESELLGVIEYSYSSLNIDKRFVKDFDIKIPWHSHTENYDVNLTMKYESQHGEKFMSSVVEKITVNKGTFEDQFELVLVNKSVLNDTLILYFQATKISNATIDKASIDIVFENYSFQYVFNESQLNAEKTEFSVGFPANVSTSNNLATSFIYEHSEQEFVSNHKFNVKKKTEPTKKEAIPPPEEEIKKPRPKEDFFNTGTMIIAVVIVLGMFFFFIFYSILSKSDDKDVTYFKPKKVQVVKEAKPADIADSAPYPTTDFEVLKTYVKECQLIGKPKEKIEKELLDNGWMPEVIEVHLK